MITCFHCGLLIENELDMILVSEDGDFVHPECEPKYYAERRSFFDIVVHGPEATKGWLFSRQFDPFGEFDVSDVEI